MAESAQALRPARRACRMKLRLSTFNCENLFERARCLNGTAEQRATWLQQAEHGSGRHAASVARHVTWIRAGALQGQWRWTSAPIRVESVQAKARVIRSVNADVQCLIEVESRAALSAFNQRYLGRRYPHHMLVEGPDEHSAHVNAGLLSRYPLASIRSHALAGDSRETRGSASHCLEATVVLPGNQQLHLLLTQLRGRDAGDKAAAIRRREAADLARIISQQYDLNTERVAVMGDFNESPQRYPPCLSPLLDMPDLTDVLAWQFDIPDDRWTGHRRRNEQLDYLLVSQPLREAFRAAGIERRGMPDLALHSIAQERPFASRGEPPSHAASSRAAIWAAFEWPDQTER